CDWVRFHDCDLRGATFTKARFTNSEFRRCRLEGIEGVGSLGGTAMALDAVLALAPA
ncbi:MAG: pentapeptide repeat-containing protein, partial [Mycobacteriales bacterium]